MCLVVSVILLIMSFNLFFASNYIGSSISLIISIFFIVMMIKNIKRVKEIRKGKR